MNSPINNEHRLAKGTLYLMIAQTIFLGTGYIIHIGLARIISPIEYGRFGVILSILMMSQIFLNLGIPETVTKFISEGRNSKIVKNKALKLQLLFSLIIFLIIFLSAPLIANILNDPKLMNYIRFASIIIPVRAVYAILRGVLNGFRYFEKSAYAHTIDALIRIISVFILIYLGFGIYGAIGGYIFGAFVALWFSYLFSLENIKGKKTS
jgi:O-antigen/teichoic acid export membrane protein